MNLPSERKLEKRRCPKGSVYIVNTFVSEKVVRLKMISGIVYNNEKNPNYSVCHKKKYFFCL